MKKGWEIMKLGEVCDVRDGTHDSPKYVEEGYPLVTSKNLKNGKISFEKIKYIKREDYDNINKRSKVNIGDILFAMIGTIGNSVIINDEPNYAIKNVALFKVNGTQSSKFLKYYFDTRYVVDKMQKEAKGTTQRFVGLGYLRNFPIPIPSLPEQKRIVAILDRTFEAIDQAKANAEQNLKNAKELFESYLQGVFENKGDDWVEKPLGELCKLTRGHNPPKSKFINEPKENHIRFYQIRDGWSDEYRVFVPKTPQLHLVEPDEMLMVAYRHIGKVFRGVSGAFNVALCKIANTKREVLNDDFLFYMIPTDIIKGELMKRSERSLIPSMSVNHLKEIIIPIPSIEEQRQIVQKLDELQAETKKLEAIYQQKIDDLEELKKSVLQKAFNGELSEKEMSL